MPFTQKKITPAQTRYTTTERELLALVETTKEYRNILLGQKITVFTDHKILTTKNVNIDRIMRWRLLLEEYWNILLGQNITVSSDHKNLTTKNFNTDRVMRWRLLEEYGPELKYLEGHKNIVADALSRLNIETSEHNLTIYNPF